MQQSGGWTRLDVLQPLAGILRLSPDPVPVSPHNFVNNYFYAKKTANIFFITRSNSIPNKILEIKNAKAKRRSGQVFHGKEGQANSAPVDNSLSLARTESTMGLMPMKGGRY